jgi:curli biogenesis system outer membrane secretion channel CsgG
MTTAIARSLSRTLFAAALALAGTVASFAATTAHAAPAGAYAAVLTTPLAAPRHEIVDGTVWRCDGDRCAAPADGARTQTVCVKVARKFGPLASFATPQGALSAEQLTRCNGAL